MARKNSPAYWSQRMKLMEDTLKDRSFSYVENMERQFMAAQAEVERQIAVWYQRFAASSFSGSVTQGCIFTMVLLERIPTEALQLLMASVSLELQDAAGLAEGRHHRKRPWL